MSDPTCINCGFTGDVSHFKNGARGRKIHEECQKCRDELANLVDEYRMLQMYFKKYHDAYRVLSLKDKEFIDGFIKSDMTPSYLLGDQFLGSLHDSHFVPIANLAFEHALADFNAGVNIMEAVKKVLGGIVTADSEIQGWKVVWERSKLRDQIAVFDTIEPGKGKQSKPVEARKKGFLRRLLGI